ncbi:hypothetical protein IJI94_00280 [Candidatus Saccharibacteria bacterium]|nr:hypothetical protein [Candidatus Saccharibacteria bacterium]
MDNQQIVSNPIPTPNNYGGYGYDSAPSYKHGSSSLVKTAALAIVSLIAVGLAVLSIYLFVQLDDARTNVEGQIDEAVAIKVKENSDQLEAEFAEREKQEYRDFLGPVDYGELSFKYPKTWSLYIARDAANGGDYEAYMNPLEVHAVSNTTIYALRIFIYNRSFESVADSYNGSLSSGNLSLEIRDLGNGVNANVYTGTLNNGFYGRAALLKIRDKTVLLQTDSQLFFDDFDNIILHTITYNA